MKNKNQKKENVKMKELSSKELQSTYGGKNVIWIYINGVCICIYY
jgi:bacteriocin-like protein